MGQVFVAFGIDWRLLIINLINFGLLLIALWYFLYGPLTRMLEDRRQQIAKGVQDANDAAEKLKSIEDARASMLSDAGKEADQLLRDARTAASTKQKELIAQGEAAAASALKSAEAQAGELKQKAIEESKQEVAKLIVLGMEKLARQK